MRNVDSSIHSVSAKSMGIPASMLLSVRPRGGRVLLGPPVPNAGGLPVPAGPRMVLAAAERHGPRRRGMRVAVLSYVGSVGADR
jgi:hypothetical protein